MSSQPKKNLLIAVIALVVVLALTAGGYALFAKTGAGQSARQTEASQSTSNGSGVFLASYDTEVYTPDGSATTLSAIANGRPLVINFWATWCPHCVNEMPDFQAMYERYGTRVAFCMLDAVDGRRETASKGKSYVAENGFTFPVYYDLTYAATEKYQVTGFPSTVVYAANGEMVGYYVGRMDMDVLESLLEELA